MRFLAAAAVVIGYIVFTVLILRQPSAHCSSLAPTAKATHPTPA
jgi:hypothetical protein